MALRKIKELNTSTSGVEGTDDPCVAAIIRYVGTASSPVYEVDTTTADAFIIDEDGDTTSTPTMSIDMTAADYDTFGELKGRIEENDGWEFILVGAAYDQSIGATTSMTILPVAASTAVGDGALIYFDLQQSDIVTVTIGSESETSLTAEARDSSDGLQTMLTRDASDDDFDQHGIRSPATVPVLLGLTYYYDGAAAPDVEVIVCDQTQDIATYTFAGVDGTQTALGADEFGAEGIIGPEGGRIIVRIGDNTTIAGTTSFNASAWGYLGEY